MVLWAGILNRRSSSGSSRRAPTTPSSTACPTGSNPWPNAAGASSRMLIYHFGSRDDLLRAVLGRARQRQLEVFGDLLRVQIDKPYTATLSRAWATMTGPQGRPYLQMFGQLRESAEQQLWPDFRRSATTDWLGPLEDGLR